MSSDHDVIVVMNSRFVAGSPLKFAKPNHILPLPTFKGVKSADG